MKLDERTKHLALGGAVGIVGTMLAISLFHGSREREREVSHHLAKREKHHRDQNERGEYGRKKKHGHHHKEH